MLKQQLEMVNKQLDVAQQQVTKQKEPRKHLVANSETRLK